MKLSWLEQSLYSQSNFCNRTKYGSACGECQPDSFSLCEVTGVYCTVTVPVTFVTQHW